MPLRLVHLCGLRRRRGAAPSDSACFRRYLRVRAPRRLGPAAHENLIGYPFDMLASIYCWEDLDTTIFIISYDFGDSNALIFNDYAFEDFLFAEKVIVQTKEE